MDHENYKAKTITIDEVIRFINKCENENDLEWIKEVVNIRIGELLTSDYRDISSQEEIFE